MEPTKIKVETIGYYHRNYDLTAVPDLLPKKLNSNRRYFEGSEQSIPYINLNVEVPNTDVGEYNMESFLDYLLQEGWPNGHKPDFVAFKQLLVYVTSSAPTSTIHAYRHGGIIFLTRMKNEIAPAKIDHAAVFKHFFTKASEDSSIDGDGILRKAVHRATVSHENGKIYSILYSGAVCATDESSNHYDFIVGNYGIRSYNLCEHFGSYLFWKMIFGNSSSLVIGKRRYRSRMDSLTGELFKDYRITEVDKIDRKKFISKISQANGRSFDWTISDGEAALRDFLTMVKDTVAADGDCFVFSKTEDEPEWKIERDEEAVTEFRNVVIRNISDD